MEIHIEFYEPSSVDLVRGCLHSTAVVCLGQDIIREDGMGLAMDRGLNMVTINATLVQGHGFHQNSGSTLSYRQS